MAGGEFDPSEAIARPPALSQGEGEKGAAALPSVRRKPRHNQWTRARMVTFLRELAATQSVALAAKAVSMSRTSAYNLRNRLQGTPFALGWEAALEMGYGQLAQAVMDRAVNGEEVQHWYHGELVGTTRRFDNRLAAWVLENPWKLGRQQVAREYTSQNFDALLERIEWASLDWEDEEHLPGPAGLGADPELAEAEEYRFEGRHSWYTADALAAAQAKGKRR